MIRLVLALPAFLLISFLNAQPSTCEKASMLLKTIDQFHFQPAILDEAFSAIVFDRFIEQLGPKNMLFTLADLEVLEPHKTQIFKEISENDCSLLKKTQPLLKKRLAIIVKHFEEFQKEKFEYKLGQTIDFYPKQAINDAEIKSWWRDYVKYLVLETYMEDNETINIATFKKQAKELKNKVISDYIKQMNNRFQKEETLLEFLEDKWLQAIAGAFDDNTSFFTPTEEKIFIEELSDEKLTYGFGLGKNKNLEAEISHIVPGSPAWNSNQLNEGDVIVKIEIDNKAYEPEHMLMSKITEILRSDTRTATFTIRKPNKKVIQIELSKAIIDVESNVIQSFVLENKQKYGYIYLPSFYTGDTPGFDQSEGCANDLTKNLIHLKREGIEGLILDLRNNGGGSMFEARLLTGLFIDHGSIAQSVEGNGEPEVMKDLNRGTVFNKPLIILMNHFSASASELLAATLKSYNRAVIVGTPSYGKSTIQVVIPLDAYRLKDADLWQDSELGYIRVTTGAFYNVDGTTHYKNGVQPDIPLPDLMTTIFGNETEESTLDIQPIEAAYYKPLSELPITELKEKSAKRIVGNKYFNGIKELEPKVKDWNEASSLPLDFESYQKRYQNYHGSSDPVAFEPSVSISVEMPLKEGNERQTEDLIMNIKEDEAIIEAIHILNDLINQK